MREIKFRAWDDEENIMYTDNTLDLVIHFNGELNGIDNETGDIIGTEYITQLELMQFTGLYDKNGKEIYEGDIVKHDFTEDEIGIQLAIVKYNVKYATFHFDPINDWMFCEKNDCEVIGNIYENPELLEV